MKLLGLALAALLSLSSNESVPDVGVGAGGSVAGAVERADEPDQHGWDAKKDDCICGISDLRKVSNPAKVDYDALLAATPQMKELKKNRIDPQSREGRALKSKAQTLVARTCRSVQTTKGHCSVWKKIAHKDQRSITDITADVTAEF